MQQRSRISPHPMPLLKYLLRATAGALFAGVLLISFRALFAPKPNQSLAANIVLKDTNFYSSPSSSSRTQSDVVQVIQTRCVHFVVVCARYMWTHENLPPHQCSHSFLLSRFMQDQPNLVDLGLARLQIFEHFCLPTIVKQTSQDFVWIIRTDPDLIESVKQPLLQMLKGHRNYIVVASNANPEGFRHNQAMEDITEHSVWVGDLNLVRESHASAQTRIVLETRLDADDGLHTNFVEYMQKSAPRYIMHPTSWNIWCAYSILEWQYSSPFQSAEDTKAGYWVGIKQPGCVTPGLTMVYGTEVGRENLPRGTHQKLHKVVASCKRSADDHCLRRFNELKPGAIRARTPTSAGMANVIVGKHGHRKFYRLVEAQASLQAKIWMGVEAVFCVSTQKVKAVRKYMTDNLKVIAADNLKGQCTKGHSCKSSSKDMLKAIMADSLLLKA